MEEQAASTKRKPHRAARRGGRAAREGVAPAPTLAEGLLARMDEEYRTYRQTVRQAVEAVEELIRTDLRALRVEVAEVRARLEALEARLAGAPLAPSVAAVPLPAGEQARRRIKWGASPEAVRETVFAQLAAMVEDPDQVSTELIKQRIPSMLRWIYGERAVFKGIEGLRREFREHWLGQRPAAAAGAAATAS